MPTKSIRSNLKIVLQIVKVLFSPTNVTKALEELKKKNFKRQMNKKGKRDLEVKCRY